MSREHTVDRGRPTSGTEKPRKPWGPIAFATQLIKNGSGTDALARLLTDKSTVVLDDWERRVREDPLVTESERITMLRGRADLAGLLASIADALTVGAEGVPRPRATSDGADESLASILRQFSHLRAALLEVALRERVTIDGARARVVHAALDDAMIASGAGHVSSRVRMLEQACEDLRTEAQVRERWIAIIGHDLRSPIQAVKATTGMLSTGHLEDAQRALVRRIDRGAARMTALARDMLDFAHARLGERNIVARREWCALRAICEDAIDELRAVSPLREIAFAASADAEGMWDQHRIAQLLVHVVGNAISYSPASTAVTVTLSTSLHTCEIAVHNWGTPIDGDDLPLLFEPFRRGRHRSSPGMNASGLGLGLFIAKAIAESHGGKITVSSSEREGTTFRIALDRGTAPRSLSS